jgi:hypothetical protein
MRSTAGWGAAPLARPARGAAALHTGARQALLDCYLRGARQALLDRCLRGRVPGAARALLTAGARQALLDRYFELLPEYQGAPLDALAFRRVLFGAFPTFADSPLRPQFDRILQVLSVPFASTCGCMLQVKFHFTLSAWHSALCTCA